MKQAENWKESKYNLKGDKLFCSKNNNEIKAGSRLIAQLVADQYSKYIPLYSKGKLLDLGCGKVPFYSLYKKYSVTQTCADWENSRHKNPFIDEYVDLNKPLPFSNASFDTIILSDVLEHIENPQLLINEISRILSPNGYLIMNVPFFYWLHEQPFDYYRYTRHALQKICKNSNINPIQINEIGGSLECIADIISKHIQLTPFIGKYLAILIQSIVYHFSKSSLGTKILTKTAEYYPLGYFLVGKKS